MTNKVIWHQSKVNKQVRENSNGHKATVFWLTGLSGAGKTTLATLVEKKLFEIGVKTYLLDGDNLRHGLNRDLNFSLESRQENVRRVGEVAHLFLDAGIVTLVSIISPYRTHRQAVRQLFKEGEFFEIFISCPLDVCKQRDPKGLYQKALSGQIKGFTGIDDPYEEPEIPDLIINTSDELIEESAERLYHFVQKKIMLNHSAI